jgi:hypothetical protein
VLAAQKTSISLPVGQTQLAAATALVPMQSSVSGNKISLSSIFTREVRMLRKPREPLGPQEYADGAEDTGEQVKLAKAQVSGQSPHDRQTSRSEQAAVRSSANL